MYIHSFVYYGLLLFLFVLLQNIFGLISYHIQNIFATYYQTALFDVDMLPFSLG